MNAVIYCRVSSKDQLDGTSLESQEAACREYAERHRLTVARAFIEEGESAKFADRTQLLAALDYCRDKRHGVTTFITWKIDRFARKVEDHYAIKAKLRSLGVRLMSVTEPIDDDPTGNLMETVLAGFAQFDNDIRAMRTVQGLQQRIRDGIFPWKPPLGYLPPKNGKKTVPDRPDPATFGPLQRAWKMMATGAYTKAAILRLLREWHVRSYRGKQLSAQAVDKLFANPFYKGVVVNPWTKEEHIGRHVPMVTVEEFDRVQTAVSRRNRSIAHTRLHRDFPLRGRVRCPSCREFMTAAWSRGRRQWYAYYACRNRVCHARRSWPVAKVHAEFEERLAELSVAPATSRTVVAALRASAEREREQQRGVRAAVESRVRQLTHQQNELISLRTRGIITEAEFLAQRNAIRRHTASLQNSSSAATQAPITDAEAEALALEVSDLRGLWRTLSPSQQHGFVQLALPHGYALREVRTAELALLFETLATFRRAESNDVHLTPVRTNKLIAEIRTFLAIIGVDIADAQSAA